ncbi:MAG: tRNA-dihydrouridine synthase family protein [Deferribacteraceae bacterium]|jgi:nifR3 family TIM-barrel protein|nr:tRNA-dihydrouridine synthase family protein [Deferribacteraceae bacterium]
MRNFFRERLAENDLLAAPMAGVTSAPFRLFLREFFSGIAYTEMVSVEGVRRSNPHSMEYLDIMNGDRPVIAQLFGGNPDSYPEAVAVAESYSAPDGYDINMGCPVKKVIKAGGGCALLTDLPRIVKIIRAMRSGTERPFSVKIRTGWDESKPIFKEVLNIAESEGADALILHARTRKQMFGGAINYEALADLSSFASIPIIGNGDVTDYESYLRIKKTGVNGVMIGRGMMKTPWIFKAVKEGKEPQNYYTPTELHLFLLKLYGNMLEHTIGRSAEQKKREHYLNIIKKFAVWFSKGLENAAQFRAEVFKSAREDLFFKLLERYFTQSVFPLDIDDSRD